MAVERLHPQKFAKGNRVRTADQRSSRGIFVNMESEFGKHRESRLKNLKSVDEKEGIGTER